MLYFDHNATTPPSPGVVRAMREALEEHWANPSSMHRPGQAARRLIEHARKQVGDLLGVAPRDIVFTGSGTESIGLAIRGVLDAGGRPSALVTDALEHSAVRQLACRLEGEGVRVLRLPVCAPGVVDPEPLAELLRAGTGAPSPIGLVSVQWANNETGFIQPIERVWDLCRAAGVLLHCDATQWVGKLPMPAGGPPCDLLTCSPHKFHGPKGVGVLWVRKGVTLAAQVLGAQERGLRGGTENVPAIAGAGVAAAEARAWLAEPERLAGQARVRDQFETEVIQRCPGAVVHGVCNGASVGQGLGHDVGHRLGMGSRGGLGVVGTVGAGVGGASGRAEPPARVWNTTNIAFPGCDADLLLMLMSERGLCASAGSACSSGAIEPSAVLRAMGVPDTLASGSIRFSIGRGTTHAEADEAARIVGECVERAGATQPRAATASGG